MVGDEALAETDEASAGGHFDRFRPARPAEFLEEVGELGFHVTLADPQLAGDFLVRFPVKRSSACLGRKRPSLDAAASADAPTPDSLDTARRVLMSNPGLIAVEPRS